MTYIPASNIPEIVPCLAFILLKVPLAPTIIQILAIDLGTDMLPALALAAERPEAGLMERPPRRRTERLLSWLLLARAYLFVGAGFDLQQTASAGIADPKLRSSCCGRRWPGDFDAGRRSRQCRLDGPTGGLQQAGKLADRLLALGELAQHEQPVLVGEQLHELGDPLCYQFHALHLHSCAYKKMMM
jgi:hypothetical protein